MSSVTVDMAGGGAGGGGIALAGDLVLTRRRRATSADLLPGPNNCCEAWHVAAAGDAEAATAAPALARALGTIDSMALSAATDAGDGAPEEATCEIADAMEGAVNPFRLLLLGGGGTSGASPPPSSMSSSMSVRALSGGGGKLRNLTSMISGAGMASKLK